MKVTSNAFSNAGGTLPATTWGVATNSATSEDGGQCCYNIFDVLDFARIGPDALPSATSKKNAQMWV